MKYDYPVYSTFLISSNFYFSYFILRLIEKYQIITYSINTYFVLENKPKRQLFLHSTYEYHDVSSYFHLSSSYSFFFMYKGEMLILKL